MLNIYNSHIDTRQKQISQAVATGDNQTTLYELVKESSFTTTPFFLKENGKKIISMNTSQMESLKR